MSQHTSTVECACGKIAPRSFLKTKVEVYGHDDWNNQTFNHGLGCYTKSNQEAKKIAKERGLEEIGNETPATIHKHYEQRREDKRKEGWDNVLKDGVHDVI